MRDRLIRAIPELIGLALAGAGQLLIAWRLYRAPTASLARQWAIFFAAGFSLVLLGFGFLLHFNRIARRIPGSWPAWLTGVAMLWMLLSIVWLAMYAVARLIEHFNVKAARRRASSNETAPDLEPHPGRRKFLLAAQAAAFAGPPAVLGYGVFIQRTQIVLREQRIDIPGLAPDLDGLRLIQLTDIHMSPFLSRREVERAVAIANENRAHVALVTGDLITNERDPLDDCLGVLSKLRSDAGTFGCMGNHENYALCEGYTEREGARLGMRFLRRAAAPLRFGSATLNLAGVDYQRLHRPYLRGAKSLVLPDACNILLSHNPDVFPVAASQGYALTISGHTHGGQVRVEILSADLNVARFYTPFVDGLYSRGPASIFVSRGIGTIGIPARFGAPPEVALLTLHRV